MSARTKLNVAFFNGTLLIAGLLGAVTQSWKVFSVALVVLLVASVITGEIRFRKRGRRDR
jgi:uncharacterized membrane protein